eukprot:GHRR01011503.1.p1 GENE.GHRR01011503.1~~GHRR01011503.1.p1  ORF type:complete len:152 (+),score=27.77 GHRR01011503.1:1974-2429(+)
MYQQQRDVYLVLAFQAIAGHMGAGTNHGSNLSCSPSYGTLPSPSLASHPPALMPTWVHGVARSEAQHPALPASRLYCSRRCTASAIRATYHLKLPPDRLGNQSHLVAGRISAGQTTMCSNCHCHWQASYLSWLKLKNLFREPDISQKRLHS